MLYRALADLVLIVHTGFIVFVVVGLVLIVAGAALRWEWVRNVWFRVAHLLAIGLVVVQAYFEIVCPLTSLENALRAKANQGPYAPGGFIQHWLHELIFFQADEWVFTLAYTLFGLLVVVTLLLVPPRWDRLRHAHRGHAHV